MLLTLFNFKMKGRDPYNIFYSQEPGYSLIVEASLMQHAHIPKFNDTLNLVILHLTKCAYYINLSIDVIN